MRKPELNHSLQAVWRQRTLHRLLDQGSTYACEDYRDLLDANGIRCSMSRRGNCLDNAAMASWFSTVKLELGETFESIHRAKEQLVDYVEVFYNQRRRHSIWAT